MNIPHHWLGCGFMTSLQRFPDRPALEINGKVMTYQALYQRAASLATTLCHYTPANDPPLTAVFAREPYSPRLAAERSLVIQPPKNNLVRS
jgi:hypothetical protein